MEIQDDNGVVRVRPTTGEKVVVALMIALLLWVGKTTLETSQGVAVLNTKVDIALQNQDRRLAELERRAAVLESYHRAD